MPDSADEERWNTLGLDKTGTLLVVTHTFRVIGFGNPRIRIISARPATKREAGFYASEPH